MSLFKSTMRKMYQKHFGNSTNEKCNSGFNNPDVTGISREIHSTGPDDNPGGPMMPEYVEWKALNIYNDQHKRWHHSAEKKRAIKQEIARGISNRLEHG